MMDSHYQILHVEDSADDAELVRLALQAAPFASTIVRVDTEPAYFAALEKCLPDVIICDYHMPEFTAERALAILRERDLDIPFIVVSSHIGESEPVIAMQQGASDYLSKARLQRLPKAIDAAIDRARARREKALAQAALARSEAMTRGILNSLDARLALLDPNGVIVATNRRWQEFDVSRRHIGFGEAPVGTNYVERLEAAAARLPVARELLVGIRKAMGGEEAMFAMEHQLDVPTGVRWYVTRVFPLEEGGGGAVVSHDDITDRMIAHIALDDAHKRLQMLSKRMLAVQEEERKAISRELHDDIGQSLAALKISLHRLAREPAVAAPATECLELADAVLEKLRRVAHELRPPQLDQLGLAEAFGWLIQRQRAATGLRIEFACNGLDARRMATGLESACYRITQEALNNAARHAHAKAVRVHLDADDALLKLSVHDDGVGFDQEGARRNAQKHGNMGLISMEERASLAGGRLRVRSVPGGGTTVSAIFPLNQAKPVPNGEEPAMAS